MDLSFLLPISLLVNILILIFLGFFWKMLAKLPKTPTLDFQPLIEEGFSQFSESVTPNFKEMLADPEVEQHLAGVVMGAIAHLFGEEETQKTIGDFLKAQIAEIVPTIPGITPKSPEDQAKIEQNVKKFTREVAMGLIDENMPPFAVGILDKKVEGWREILGDSPETLAGVAGFLSQIGLRAKGEDVIQKVIGNIAGSVGASNPGASRGSGGVRG